MQKTILLIDDDPIMRQVIELKLELLYKIVTADNGATGLKRFKKGQHDLIITDLVMPEMDGIKLIQNIRLSNKKTPIVAITGYNNNRKDDIIAKGANLIIEKPFRMDHFMSHINIFLGNK